MRGEDLTESRNNPLIPTGEDPVDPMLDPGTNPLIVEDELPGCLRSKRPSAALVDEILKVFKDDELEISAAVVLQRMAGGAVNLVKDGRSIPLKDASPEDIERVRTALKL